MAKKNEVRTLSVILNEINEKVNEYNGLNEADPKRAELTVFTKKLVEEYNELSLLTVFGKCMATALPLKAFVETFAYNVVSVADKPHKELQPDGSKKDVYTRSVTEKDRMLDLAKFIDWAAESNKQVAHSKDWRKLMLTAKQAVKTEWKKYLASKGDSHSVSTRKMKAALQDMFDALIFIATEKGSNSVVASGAIAKFVFAGANKLNPSVDAEASDLDILPESNWKVLVMKSLRTAVTGKEIIINYNEGEDEAAEAKAEEAADETK